MSNNITITDHLAPFAAIGAALCPIPAGGKSPVGIIASFAHDWSKDPEQWRRWHQAHPDCNWIMVAGPSQIIVVDIDVKTKGRDEAWAVWCEWCQSRGLPVYRPQVETPSQGWHIYFKTDAIDLRQPPLVPGVIDVRAGNGFVLIPPSVVDGRGYKWLA